MLDRIPNRSFNRFLLIPGLHRLGRDRPQNGQYRSPIAFVGIVNPTDSTGAGIVRMPHRRVPNGQDLVGLERAWNAGERSEGAAPDGFASLINRGGSVHNAKWIGATRGGFDLASLRRLEGRMEPTSSLVLRKVIRVE